MDFYKCVEVYEQSKTWDGNKAILSGAEYEFEEKITNNLTYGDGYKPIVGNIYNDNAIVAIKGLNQKFPTDFVFFDSLSEQKNWQLSGVQIVSDEKRNVFQLMDSSDNAVININPGNLPLNSSPRTMSHWFKASDDNYYSWCGIGYGTSGGNNRFTWGIRNNYSVFTMWANDNFQSEAGFISDREWHNYITTYDGLSKVKHYIDGEFVWEWEAGKINTNFEYIHVGDPWEGYAAIGRYADMYIFNRVLDESEVVKIANMKTV